MILIIVAINKYTQDTKKEIEFLRNKLKENRIDKGTEESLFKMHDNIIECRGLVLASSCKTFSGNTLNRVGKLQVESDVINTVINSWYTASTDISDISFDSLGNNIFSTTTLKVPLTNVKIDSIINSEINKSISDSTFKHIKECVFNNQFFEVHFKNLNLVFL